MSMSEDTEPIVACLNHVIGQSRAVAVLQTALSAYFNDRLKTGVEGAFPHVLMCGAGGTGKTLSPKSSAANVVRPAIPSLPRTLPTLVRCRAY